METEKRYRKMDLAAGQIIAAIVIAGIVGLGGSVWASAAGVGGWGLVTVIWHAWHLK